MRYTNRFDIRFDPMANPEAIISVPGLRLTILTSRLLRLEVSPEEVFIDRPSQAFWFRRQPVPEFTQSLNEKLLAVETGHLRLSVALDGGRVSPAGLTIRIKESGETWHFGQDDELNLRGTARTLDNVDGRLPLEQGLLSRRGWAVYDDSNSLLFTEDGWLEARPDNPGGYDLYFFGYGRDYDACLAEFSRIAGPAPLLPRWALGNWWSRYWPYTADELLDLMDAFRVRQFPLAVCIVDMDWHITDTGNASSGWTGYTWNKNLFPDPPAFIAALHQRGLKTALNLHPAEGIYPHEAQYGAMAEALGLDAEAEEAIPFNIANPDFTQAYFELLHHPYEAQGIDFWWMDWQQGGLTDLPGLDPLWWLNHLHFYDLARADRTRPFIFSRWGGLGNHRYPIGFSGDTHITWRSLAFQPYFTATAANVNYGWWSHDIGGHMYGVEEGELYTRWVQFGVFSPIFRLHSTNNPFHERRPWGYDAQVAQAAGEAMRLRHQLIPYLYTMAWHNHQESRPLVRPMYHEYPHEEPAYHCPDQYLFGSELLVAPFMTPMAADTRLSRQVVWLPPGEWYGFFDGLPLPGDGWQPVFGTLEDIPVFARPGAIVPLAPPVGWGGVENPQDLLIHCFPGSDRSFLLYEDDGFADYSLTPISQRWTANRWEVRIAAVQGHRGHLPQRRTITVLLRSLEPGLKVMAALNGRALEIPSAYDPDSRTHRLTAQEMGLDDELLITAVPLEETFAPNPDYRLVHARRLVRAFRLESGVKHRLDFQLPRLLADPRVLNEFEFSLTPQQKRALVELSIGAGYHRRQSRDKQGEALLLWNNQAVDLAQYRLTTLDQSRQTAVHDGPLPRFALLSLGERALEFHVGSQPAKGKVTVDDWFDSLVERSAGVNFAGLKAVVQFKIDGENGRSAHLVIDEGQLALVEGDHQMPDAAISTAAAAWLALINGEAAPEELLAKGQLVLTGNLNLVIGLAGMIRITPEGRYLSDPWKLMVTYLDGLVFNEGPA